MSAPHRKSRVVEAAARTDNALDHLVSSLEEALEAAKGVESMFHANATDEDVYDLFQDTLQKRQTVVLDLTLDGRRMRAQGLITRIDEDEVGKRPLHIHIVGFIEGDDE